MDVQAFLCQHHVSLLCHVSKNRTAVTSWHNFTSTALMSVVFDMEKMHLILNYIKTFYESYVLSHGTAEAINIATLT